MFLTPSIASTALTVFGRFDRFRCREQLEHNLDVGSQLEATAAFTTFTTYPAIDALDWALNDHTNYYRVRVAAVEALTRLVLPLTDYEAKYKLLDYMQKAFFGDEVPLPNDFSDLSLYSVRKACIEGIGNCRDSQNKSFPDCIGVLHALLDDNDNSNNEYDDGYSLGATIRALASAVCAGGATECASI